MPITYDILASKAVSVSEFKKSPVSIMDTLGDNTLAVLSNNKPAFYCLSEKMFIQLQRELERLEDIELGRIATSRLNEPRVPVKLDDL